MAATTSAVLHWNVSASSHEEMMNTMMIPAGRHMMIPAGRLMMIQQEGTQ